MDKWLVSLLVREMQIEITVNFISYCNGGQWQVLTRIRRYRNSHPLLLEVEMDVTILDTSLIMLNYE